MRHATALLLIAAAACAKGDDGAKRVPEPPPPPAVEIAASLNIPVNLDGRPVPPVDKKRLEAVKPDFLGEDHRAWKLSSVLGSVVEREGSVIEATGKNGASITMRRPAEAGGPQPCLVLTRRGEIAAALVDPEDPFPDYHGRGGRLRRPGDPLPRVAPVALLRVYVERAGGTGGGSGGGRGASATTGAAAVKSVDVRVDGESWTEWHQAFDDLETKLIMSDGEQRESWPVRGIAERVGAGARLVKVVGETGAVDIDPATWADASRVPTLRTNRRGTNVKFQWSNANGDADKRTEIRGVTALEFATK